jgi:hypothetical protein
MNERTGIVSEWLRPAIVVALLLWAAVVGAEVRQDASGVSLLQLLATPERYDGVLVRTIGFLWLEFEGNKLYLHREDYEHAIVKQAVWLDFPQDPTAEQRRLRGNYVLVEGVFNAKRGGHMGLSTGAIEKISRLELWSEVGKGTRRGVPSD